MNKILVVSGGILAGGVIIWSIWFLFIRLDRVETMSVRSKEWSREIRELEDYQTYECHTRTRTVEDCSYRNGERQCTTRSEPYQECGWETHTRLINGWPTSGVYPVKPYWQTGYIIGPGHYERRFENYIVYLSDDREIWSYRVTSEAWYDTFPVKGKCSVGLNWVNSIVKVEC